MNLKARIIGTYAFFSLLTKSKRESWYVSIRVPRKDSIVGEDLNS